MTSNDSAPNSDTTNQGGSAFQGGSLYLQYLGPLTQIANGAYARDPLFAQLLIESAVGQGVETVAFLETPLTAEIIKSLDPLLQKRVRLVDGEEPSKRASALLGPLIEAHNMELLGSGAFRVRSTRGEDPSALQFSVMSLHLTLCNLLVCQRHRLMSHNDIRLDGRAIERLMFDVRGTANGTALTALLAIARSYSLSIEPVLITRPNAPLCSLHLLEEVIESAEFKEAQAQSVLLGYRKKAAHSLAALRRSMQKIATNPRLLTLFKLGARSVEIAGGGQLPTEEGLAVLTGSTYLPPIVSVDPVYSSAWRRWKALGYGEAGRQISPATLAVFDRIVSVIEGKELP